MREEKSVCPNPSIVSYSVLSANGIVRKYGASFKAERQIFALNVLFGCQHPLRKMMLVPFVDVIIHKVERLFNGVEANICEKCLAECIAVCNDILAHQPDGSFDVSMPEDFTRTR